jgi:prevent-host-death family protein
MSSADGTQEAIALMLQDGMTTVGLRELRQHASDLVRQVEAGDEITITVSGRASARLVPVHPRTWRTYSEIADVFAGGPDEHWERDRELIDDSLRDPWTSR